MKPSQFKDLVKGTIFSVEFTKKDGSTRKLNGRLGVVKHLKGGEKKYVPEDFNMVTVFDLAKKEYRTINLDTLKQVKARGKTLNIDDTLFNKG